MIERQHGKVVVVCDTCGEGYDTGESDFATAKILFDAEGWLTSRITGGEYAHTCPECIGPEYEITMEDDD